MSAPTKVCEHCGKAKPATEKYFGLYLRSRDRLKSYCRDCGSAVAAERRKRKTVRAREWAKNNPEKVKASKERAAEKNRLARSK